MGPVVGPQALSGGQSVMPARITGRRRAILTKTEDMDGGLWMAWSALVVAIALIWWLMKLGRGALFGSARAGQGGGEAGLGAAALPGSGEADPAPGSRCGAASWAARRQRRQARLLPLHPGARGPAPAQRLLWGLSHDPTPDGRKPAG